MRSPAFPPRRPSVFFRYAAPACLVLIIFCYLGLPAYPRHREHQLQQSEPPSPPLLQEQAGQHGTKVEANGQRPIDHDGAPAEAGHLTPEPSSMTHAAPPPSATHPIDHLIEAAEKKFEKMLASESHSVAEAAAAYRRRRGRHPPPGFDRWYEFAIERNAVMVEEFWDPVYHDLNPFWAIPAPQIRKEAWDFEMTISVRGGNATAQSDWFWTKIWLQMIKSIEHLLPDLDMALNAMDEPRLVVPWEQMQDYMAEAEKTVRMVNAKDAVRKFQNLASPGQGSDRSAKTRDKNWEDTRPFWNIARRGCAPTSPARVSEVLTTFDGPPHISESSASRHMYNGYVSNYTLSTDICHQADLQGLEGIFIEPLSVSSTKTLFPMFGGSKLAVNNEILLPAPMYWSDEERFTGGDDHGGPWHAKEDGAIWRGVATGGKNRENNWKGFQRHRFVAMNNGTKLGRAEEFSEVPQNFALPSATYGLNAQKDGRLGAWVDEWSNCSFVDLMCSVEAPNGTCPYTSPYFATKRGVKMQEQFRFKYLPDIDGNSFSGRYLAFLRSSSLPIKATIWREWHDSRLVAWKHFVPMDSRFGDWFGIMEYFLGYKDIAPAHDAAAERIATAGQQWAERVLRKEDMQIYVLRLLLEYARVCDEKRETMGWVDDLLHSEPTG